MSVEYLFTPRRRRTRSHLPSSRSNFATVEKMSHPLILYERNEGLSFLQLLRGVHLTTRPAQISLHAYPSIWYHPLDLCSFIYFSHFTILVPTIWSSPHGCCNRAMIDWTRPWTFLDELHTWLAYIESWVQGNGARELQLICEEYCERCASLSSILPPPALTSPRPRAGTPAARH